MKRLVLCFLAIVITTIGSPAWAKKRFALVMGNANYTTVSPLKNPVNDANLMAKTLESVGFEVTKVTDANLRQMRRALIDFGRKLRGQEVEASLFYYAGHGIQTDGRNYILPVGTNLKSKDELSLEGIAMNDFVTTIASGKADFNIMIFDACRNNPFSGDVRDVGAGLARIKSPEGSYIAFSAEAGEVAEDGTGDNSIFTQALAKNMSVPGVTIESVFKKTREAVYVETDQRQRTWDESSIIGEFYFNEATKKTTVPVKKLTGSLTQRVDEVLASRTVVSAARSEWDLVKGSLSAATLQLFMARHPGTIEAAYAQARLNEIGIASKESAAPKPAPEPLKAEVVQPGVPKVEVPKVVEEKQPEQPIVVAKLEPEVVEPIKQPAVVAPRPILEIQTKLQVAGCYTSALDGIWGRGSIRALRNYAKQTGIRFSSLEPTADTLVEIGKIERRVCAAVVVAKPKSKEVTKRKKRVRKQALSVRPQRAKPRRVIKKKRRAQRARKRSRRARVQRTETRGPVNVKRRNGGVRGCIDRRVRQGESHVDARFACLGGS